MSINIHIREEEIPQNPTVVVSFPGIGMVGGIAAEHLIDTLEMKEIGQILISELPPIALIHKGRPRRPVRIFKKEDLVLFKSDMVIPPESCFPLAQELVTWAKKTGVNKVITLDSFPSKKTPENKKAGIWGVITDHKLENDLKNLDVPVLETGLVSGPSALILVECVETEILAYGMYAEANPWMPDPQSTANILNKLSDLINIEINVETLLERAKEIKEQYEEMVHRAREASNKMEKEEPTSMYR